jgi:hypothetical protein
VALTFAVALLLLRARFRAAYRKQVTPGDFRYGESDRVPPEARLPSRNLVNLLEMPVLFYVACVILYVIGAVDAAGLALAWAYVACRALHSLIHLTYTTCCIAWPPSRPATWCYSLPGSAWSLLS